MTNLTTTGLRKLDQPARLDAIIEILLALAAEYEEPGVMPAFGAYAHLRHDDWPAPNTLFRLTHVTRWGELQRLVNLPDAALSCEKRWTAIQIMRENRPPPEAEKPPPVEEESAEDARYRQSAAAVLDAERVKPRWLDAYRREEHAGLYRATNCAGQEIVVRRVVEVYRIR